MGRIHRDEKVILTIGENIKVLIRKKNLTQGEFYDDTGIHAGRVVSGKLNMTVSTLQKIANYLDVSVYDLTK